MNQWQDDLGWARPELALRPSKEKIKNLLKFNLPIDLDRGQEVCLCRADFFSRAASAASVRQGAINYYNNQTIQSINHGDRRNRERTRHASLVQPHKGGTRVRR